jgi:hypothetical protein
MPRNYGINEQYDFREWGLMRTTQKKYNDLSFPVWSAVQDCEQQECVSVEVCPYMGPEGLVMMGQPRKDGQPNRSKCQVMLKYLKQVEGMVSKRKDLDLDEFDWFKVGIHIIPLYKQLCRFKIIEMSIPTAKVSEMTKQGTTKVHSIFKEIRECLKSIDLAWRELDINTKKVRKLEPDFVEPKRGYYEVMEKEALKEQGTAKETKKKNSRLVRRS